MRGKSRRLRMKGGGMRIMEKGDEERGNSVEAVRKG
jgi:hypothetical protein